MPNYQGTATLEVPVDIQVENPPGNNEDLDKLMVESAIALLGISEDLADHSVKWSVEMTDESSD